MLLYSLQIATKSLRRSPYLTALLVGAIAIGIALSTTFAAVRHAFEKNPVPHKSATLFYVRMDNWDPLAPYPGDEKAPPTQITYRDMVEIMKSKIPVRQTGGFKTELYVHPDASAGRPFRESARMVFSDFFEMFEAPFQYGGAWTKDADASPEQMIVLGHAMNDKLFGGANSVGKNVRIEDRDFRVTGVLAPWNPGLRVYDLTSRQIAQPEEIYLPFNQLIPMKLRTSGNSDAWRSPDSPGFEGQLQSDIDWIQMWVELPSADALPAYEDFLRAYVLEQKKGGRFPRPLNNRVTSIPDLMKEWKTTPPQANALFIVSLFFFVLCSVNLIGILLGKFLSRASEVGVRRALGASRADIFLQHIVECEVVGILGGAIGIGLSNIGISILNNMMKRFFERSDLFQLDLYTLAFAVALALISGLVAGVYPAWKICRIAPASHLKAT
jgi:putative ABC transport system permease protein